MFLVKHRSVKRCDDICVWGRRGQSRDHSPDPQARGMVSSSRHSPLTTLCSGLWRLVFPAQLPPSGICLVIQTVQRPSWTIYLWGSMHRRGICHHVFMSAGSTEESLLSKRQWCLLPRGAKTFGLIAVWYWYNTEHTFATKSNRGGWQLIVHCIFIFFFVDVGLFAHFRRTWCNNYPSDQPRWQKCQAPSVSPSTQCFHHDSLLCFYECRLLHLNLFCPFRSNGATTKMSYPEGIVTATNNWKTLLCLTERTNSPWSFQMKSFSECRQSCSQLFGKNLPNLFK